MLIDRDGATYDLSKATDVKMEIVKRGPLVMTLQHRAHRRHRRLSFVLNVEMPSGESGQTRRVGERSGPPRCELVDTPLTLRAFLGLGFRDVAMDLWIASNGSRCGLDDLHAEMPDGPNSGSPPVEGREQIVETASRAPRSRLGTCRVRRKSSPSRKSGRAVTVRCPPFYDRWIGADASFLAEPRARRAHADDVSTLRRRRFGSARPRVRPRFSVRWWPRATAPHT